MNVKTLTLLLTFGATASTALAQQNGFVIRGSLPGLKDGVNVAILSDENRSAGVIAETTAKNGRFELRGKLGHPQLCTLITNNLAMRDKQEKPDTIRWTYTPVFASDTVMTVVADSYADVPDQDAITDKFKVIGGQPQADFNEYNKALKAALKNCTAEDRNNGRTAQVEDSVAMAFIGTHRQSVVSARFANIFLQRGYNLTADQLSYIERSLIAVPGDTARFNEFKNRLAYAKNTAVGAPLVDLEMKDKNGRKVNLKNIVKQGHYTLVEFWASWCGMCIAAMPEIQQIKKDFGDKLEVIGVSCDKKTDAWLKAVAKHPNPWPQYMLTEQGFKDFFNKYQVGEGVPYYTLIAPNGRVMKAPQFPSDIRQALNENM